MEGATDTFCPLTGGDHEYGNILDEESKAVWKQCRLCKHRPAQARGGPSAVQIDAVQSSAVEGARTTNISFVAEQEPLIKYEFEDGSRLVLSLRLMNVERIEGAFNPDGTPMYNLSWDQSMRVFAPTELRRKP